MLETRTIIHHFFILILQSQSKLEVQDVELLKWTPLILMQMTVSDIGMENKYMEAKIHLDYPINKNMLANF